MGKFEITKRKNGEYQFNLKASNGQVILTSEGYSSKSGVANGIQSVKKNSLSDSSFDKRIAKNGSPYFVLLGGNRQIIGLSEMYSSSSACDNGIASVKSNAPDAEVVDLTEE